MPDESEVIRQQMEETRASLANKLETLEQHVVETVTGTTAAVNETVENVKEAVQDTVGAVKDTVQGGVETVRNAFDLSRQMDEHPWLFLAGSVAVGFLAERLMEEAGHAAARGSFSSPGRSTPSAPTGDGLGAGFAATQGTRPGYEAPTGYPRQAGFLSTLRSQFSGEFDKIKSLAVGAGLGMLRDLVSQALPEAMKPQVTEVIDSFTTKLGGEVVHGPVMAGMCGEKSPGQETAGRAKSGSPLGSTCC